jgi:hypothetical protein
MNEKYSVNTNSNIDSAANVASRHRLRVQFLTHKPIFKHYSFCPEPWATACLGLRSCFYAGVSLRSVDLPAMPLKHCIGRVARTQAQRPLPGMRNHLRRCKHQLLHHRLEATAPGCVAHRRIRPIQGVSPNQPQHSHYCGSARECKLAQFQTAVYFIALAWQFHRQGLPLFFFYIGIVAVGWQGPM